MKKIGTRAGLIAALVTGSLLLANVAFAMCAKGSDQADAGKKAVCSCSCCCCSSCK